MYTLFFVPVFVLIYLLSLYLRNKSLQRSASYKLYAVRRELVCLVAEEKLQKEGKIFQYYYGRTNLLLQLVPHVGLDNAMEAFLLLRKNKGFEDSLKEAAQQAEEMAELVEGESNGVSDVVADYYAASKNLILVHSSALRMLYLVAVKYQLPELVSYLIPDLIRAGIRTVKFAESEEVRFRQVTHHA